MFILFSCLLLIVGNVDLLSAASSFGESYNSAMQGLYQINIAPNIARDNVIARAQKVEAVSKELAYLSLKANNPVNYITSRFDSANYRKFQPIITQCELEIVAIVTAAINKQMWAIRYLDALFKLPAGILDGNLNWFGAFDECTNIKGNAGGVDIPPQYCLVQIDGLLKLGVCVPKSCNISDLVGLVAEINTLVHTKLNFTALNITTSAKDIQCIDLNPPLNNYTWVTFGIVGVIVVLSVLSTAYDIRLRINRAYFSSDFISNSVLDISASSNLFFGTNTSSVAIQPHIQTAVTTDDEAPLVSDIDKPPLAPDSAGPTSSQNVNSFDTTAAKVLSYHEWLMSFSLFQNINKVVNVENPTSRTFHTLQALHGIRLLTMFWVLLSHSILLGIMSGIDNALTLLKLMQDFEFQIIFHGFYAIDTFLVLGGFLLGYLTIRQLDRLDMSPENRVKNMLKFFGKFYLHRYLRLTPALLLTLLIYLGIAPYFMYGPVWQQTPDPLCTTDNRWWANLLYIQNLVYPAEKQCMIWTWYLAVDFQLFLISPIPLLAFYWRPIAGWLVSLTLILISAVTSGVTAAKYDFSAAPFSPTVQNISAPLPNIAYWSDHFISDYFISPWCRAAPWAIGLALGCAIHRMPPSFSNARLQTKTIRIVTAVVGWTISTILGLVLIYGMWPVYAGHYDLPAWVSHLYWAGSRIGWGLAVSWVIYTCVAGVFPGNFIRRFLAWSPFIPLSRMTYFAFLLHPIIIGTYFWKIRHPIHLFDMEMVYLFFGSLILTFMSVFITAVGFEVPLSNVEKLIFKKREHRD